MNEEFLIEASIPFLPGATEEDYEKGVKSLIGTPIKDQKGDIIGTVISAKVEKDSIMCGIKVSNKERWELAISQGKPMVSVGYK